MRFRMLPIVSLCAGLNATAQIPSPVLPSGVGVNIHFTRGHERDLDMIAAAGFKFVRMDFDWASIERTQGEYDWSAYDELTAKLAKRGIRPYYILDYSNPLYEGTVISKNPITGREERQGTASPQHPDSVAAFARWAAAAARHFHGRHVVWEIWNEPNISFWHPKPDVEQYTTLALATCKAIREAEPHATIVAPASSGFAWAFLESFLRSGVLAYLDGVSVHPYRSPRTPPETAAADFERLRQLIARYAPTPTKSRMPILSGEWGYSSNTKGVSLETQADFIARQQLSNLLCGVPISIWYDWKNDGEDPNENEHNFGTVNFELKPKPAYHSIQMLTRELSGYRIGRRYDTGKNDDFALVLTNSVGARKLAAWTLAKPHEVTFELKPAFTTELSFVTSNGEQGEVEVRQNHFTCELSGAPRYVSLGEAHLR